MLMGICNPSSATRASSSTPLPARRNPDTDGKGFFSVSPTRGNWLIAINSKATMFQAYVTT